MNVLHSNCGRLNMLKNHRNWWIRILTPNPIMLIYSYLIWIIRSFPALLPERKTDSEVMIIWIYLKSSLLKRRFKAGILQALILLWINSRTWRFRKIQMVLKRKHSIKWWVACLSIKKIVWLKLLKILILNWQKTEIVHLTTS